MNATERKEIVELIQPNTMPDAVKINVNTADTTIKSEVEMIPQDEEVVDLSLGVEEIEEEENSDFDFSNLNKLQLVELLEATVQDADVAKIKDKVTNIKVNFTRLNKEDRDRELAQFLLDGGEKENYEHSEDPLEIRFKAAFDIYRDNKIKFNENLEKQKQENLQLKLGIIEELKNLVNSNETLKKTYDEFRALQDKWKEIGQVPMTEVSNLWNSYHFFVEKFYDKVKINRELRDLDLKKNLESKLELCAKAEELLTEKSLTKAFKLLQKYHDEWKEIGPVPQDKKDEIWERFKNTTDKINQIRRDHYSKIQEEQQANYNAKVAICEKIESLLAEPINSISAYQKKTDEVNKLFNEWKEIGSAQKKQNDEVWERFKSSMDTFFKNKKQHFSDMKSQQMENYNKKLQLCAEAEKLLESKEWNKDAERMKKLQEEWKAIGPVPKRHSEKLWNRFHTVCDTFFKNRSEFFSGIKGEEDENLRLKKELIERIKAYEIQNERNDNMEAIRAFQKEWNAIGYVPIKMKESIQTEYRAAIDAIFEKMKLSEDETSAAIFRNMVENLKDDPDARNKIKKERLNITNRINKIREEISILENNIGFFSNSKQSEIMKAEYEKKINKAKAEVKSLEKKLIILSEQ